MCDVIFIHAQKHIETCDQNILQSHSENSRCKPFSVHLPVCAYRVIMKLSGNGTWRLSMLLLFMTSWSSPRSIHTASLKCNYVATGEVWMPV